MTKIKKTYDKAVTQEEFLYKKNAPLDEEYNSVFSKPLDSKNDKLINFDEYICRNKMK